jgi:calcineurin-like phosphoesterase family protein
LTVWFTSDHHFNHANIIRYCSRPFSSVEEMNERMIEEWNSRVSQADTVYVVGDFFLGLPEAGLKIAKRLSGRKVLIKGNHDRAPALYLGASFASVSHRESLQLADGSWALLRHCPVDACYLADHDLQIHGHVHAGPRLDGRRLNVCVDLWDFRPVSESELIELWKSGGGPTNLSQGSSIDPE